MAEVKFTLKIWRGTPRHQYFEEFEIVLIHGMNIVSVLMEIQKNPVSKEGKRTTPVVWEMACLEEVCGSCSMLINGLPRQSCSTLIEPLLHETGKDVITLAPFSKFPLVRDLYVNRDRMFESLKRVSAWNPIDTTFSPEFGPTVSPKEQDSMYTESTCMTCGCCLEACPQFSSSRHFIGAAAISQVKLFNSQPIGSLLKGERLTALMDKGGISECGNAQNCVAVCPKHIPLTESIADIGGEASRHAFQLLFGLPN